MSFYGTVQNVKQNVSGSHRFINIGSWSNSVPISALVSLNKTTAMTVENCNVGVGTTQPRATIDVVGNTYITGNVGIGTTLIGLYGLNIKGNVYCTGVIDASSYTGSLSGVANSALVASNTLNLTGAPDITVGTATATTFYGPLAGVANSTVVSSNNLGSVTGSITCGNMTCTNITGTSATLSGTLTTSNMLVLGSNTTINTYMTETSNFSVCNITGTGPALSVINRGTGSVAEFYDLDVSATVPSLTVNSGNVGIGTTQNNGGKLHVEGSIYVSASVGIGTTIIRDTVDVVGNSIISGNLGIGTSLPVGRLTIGSGTTTLAPILFAPSATVLQAQGVLTFSSDYLYACPISGALEYLPVNQLFQLNADGLAIGSAISNFFGATSSINLSASYAYELEAYCYFTKTTAGTILAVTLTTSVAETLLNATVDYGAAAGGNATGAANRITLAGTTNAFAASASLTTGVNHAFFIRAMIITGTSASTLTINFTEGAGTVTPLKGSYYTIRRLS